LVGSLYPIYCLILINANQSKSVVQSEGKNVEFVAIIECRGV